MGAITWSHTFIAGETLTHTLLEQMKTDITTQVNGALNSTNVVAGGLTNDRLASDLYSPIVISCLYNTAASVGGIANGVGLAASLSSIDFPFEVEYNCTLVAVETSCIAAQDTGAGANDARVRNADTSTDLAGTTTLFATGVSTRTTGLALSLVKGTQYVVRCNTSAGANDGVCGGQVILHIIDAS